MHHGVTLECQIVDDNGNLVDQLLMTVPFDDVEIVDDWYTLGLRGTCSNSVKMKNVFVPDHRAVSFVEALDGNFASEHLRDISSLQYSTFSFINLIIGTSRFRNGKSCA